MQYFTLNDFQELLSREINFKINSLDSYNEEQIWLKLKNSNKIDEYCAISVQLSLVGYSNKNSQNNFGSVTLNNFNINIKSFFEENNIKFDNKLNATLEQDDLTPRRLIRFFRYCTQKYLENNPNASSYLYRKYCPMKNSELRKKIFPGIEHILEPNEEDIEIAKILIKTYHIVDSIHSSDISKRIRSVLIARGFPMELFDV